MSCVSIRIYFYFFFSLSICLPICLHEYLSLLYIEPFRLIPSLHLSPMLHPAPSALPEPCWLPEVTHGNYTGSLFPGGHVAHGQEVDYSCEEGWLVGIPRVTCHLGHLRPVPPTCVTPAEATHPKDTLLTPLIRTASSEQTLPRIIVILEHLSVLYIS